MKFKYEIIVSGMKRSGHHAIIEWLIGHFNNTVLFGNCLIEKNDKLVPHSYASNTFCNNEVITADEFAKVNDHDCIIMNLEDRNIEIFESTHREMVPQPGDVEKRFHILVLRDPFNWIASRMKHPQRTDIPINADIIEKWIKTAKECKDETNCINNKVVVLYNKWFSSEDYRRSISKKMGLEFSDRNLEKVPPVGTGSSFVNCLYDGKAQQMKVLERYKTYKDNINYKNIFQAYPELAPLSSLKNNPATVLHSFSLKK